MAIVGYAMLIATKTPAIQYAGSIVVAAGLLPSVTTLLAWVGGNFAGEVKRAVVIAIVIGLGDFGGQVSYRILTQKTEDLYRDAFSVVGSFIYRPQDSPRYLPGHAACMASLLLLYAPTLFFECYDKH